MTTQTAARQPRKATSTELGAAALFAVAMVVLAGSLVQRRLQGAPKAPGDLLSSQWIVPAAPQEGVVVTPGGGHLLSVDTSPEGAAVMLDGALLGQTPFSSDFPCTAQDRPVLELKKPGFLPARFELECVSGSTRVTVTLKAKRAPP